MHYESNLHAQVEMVNEESRQVILQSSPYSVSETVDKLVKVMKSKGITLFAFIDHSEEAKKVNMELPEEKLLIFGDPKIGTFLMQENPVIGIDLPLKILVWQDGSGKTQVAYKDPSSIGELHKIAKNREILKKMTAALNQMIKDAVQ